MSTLAWVRLDTAMPRNQKVLALTALKEGHRAAFVWLCSLSYAGEQGTDGFIPHPALPMIHGRPVDANRLVDVGLWVPMPGGWNIHDWADYQQSNAETEKRTARAKAMAEARWGKRRAMPDAMPRALPTASEEPMPNAMQRRGEERRGLRGEGGQVTGKTQQSHAREEETA